MSKTTTIERFDRNSCAVVAAAAEEAMREVAVSFGVTLESRAGRYDSGTFAPKFTFICKGEGGVPADFIATCKSVGLEVSDFGREFRTRQGTYTVSGIRLRNRKFPILATCCATGRVYKFTSNFQADHLPNRVAFQWTDEEARDV